MEAVQISESESSLLYHRLLLLQRKQIIVLEIQSANLRAINFSEHSLFNWVTNCSEINNQKENIAVKRFRSFLKELFRLGSLSRPLDSER